MTNTPLVAVSMALSSETTSEERVLLYKEIERFIFLCFRVAGFNSSYKSSDYYNKTRAALKKEITLKSITNDLRETVDKDMNGIISNFITRTDRRFDSGSGFYGWREIRYFLYEYESNLSDKNKLQKLDWQMFTKTEKDKITIEHILPQTPTKWYWQNQFRQYEDGEIKTLSASLGNLLPLAQSINSSLQNDSFPDKKKPHSGRRGYINGSHSEIEVAKEENWDADTILKRGLLLLEFMEKRWRINIDYEDKMSLLHINFVNDQREVVPELNKEKFIAEKESIQRKINTKRTDLQNHRYNFWNRFVEYCRSKGRAKDIASRKPSYESWYDVSVASKDYHIFFQLIRQDILRIGLYVYLPESFNMLYSFKDEIEKSYGLAFEWNTSGKNSTAKRILHSIETDIENSELYTQNFDWLINQFDKMKISLEKLDACENKKIKNTNNINILNKDDLTIDEQMVDTVNHIIKKYGIGHEASSQEIHKKMMLKYGTNSSSIIPADYCYNRINKGISIDKPTLFGFLYRGKYKCLGLNYPYNGPIYHKAKGQPETLVGRCIDGVRIVEEEEN